MTTVFDQTLAAARSHEGVNEYPPGTNHQPFSTALGRPAEAWCADYVDYCDHIDCGLDFAWLGLGPTGSPSCAVITYAGQKAGRFGHIPRVDSWVMFGAGGGSHVERVLRIRVRRADGTTAELDHGQPRAGETPIAILSVGGNTSAPDNYNGGTVAEHWRTLGAGDDIYGYVYPPYSDAPAPPLTQEDLVEPVVMARNDVAGAKTAWLVMATGVGPCGLVKIAMGDVADLRNRPDGYGPVVEVDVGQLKAIPLTDGTLGAV